MDNIKYLSVRERCFRALEAHLKSIRVDNGFNNTVNQVWRHRGMIPEMADNPIEIYMVPGPAQLRFRDQIRDTEIATIEIGFVESAEQYEDLIYNEIVYDILKSFDIFDVIDNTHPQERIVAVETLGHQPLYTETRKGFVVGKIDVEMEYAYLRKDPGLWDLQDLLVEREI